MRVQNFGPVVALLFLLSACDMPGKCKVGKTGSEASNCPVPHTFCYGGEKPKEGAKGICVYGELSAGKPVAKITTWKLVLPNQPEVAPLVWDKKDEGVANNANAGWVGMAEAKVEVEVVGSGQDEALKVWASQKVNAECEPPAERNLKGELWTCSFKRGWASAPSETKTIEVRAQAGKADARVRTYRVLCSHDDGLTEDTVMQPLAMSGEQLLFGTSAGGTTITNSSLYVFDTATCTLVDSLRIGTLQGPMVVLGDTGQVAVATGNNGLWGRDEHWLSLVDMSEKPARFDYDKVCAPEAVVFDRGLSLLSLSNASTGAPWRLVAPANNPSTQQAHLLAYTPDAELCVFSEPISGSFLIPVSQNANGDVLGIYGVSPLFFRGWRFNGKWTDSADSELKERTLYIEDVSSLAVADNGYVVGFPSSADFVAIDNQGRVYSVAASADSYFLQGVLEKHHKRSTLFEGAPVGSPILGEPLPGGEAEVYVVTTTGRVLAYGVELGEPLWTYDLGIRKVAPMAQPVLYGDTLWVVGTRGEIRGIRVGSHGLSRTAQWPKAFRDNCNTSSRLSTLATLPSCFQ